MARVCSETRAPPTRANNSSLARGTRSHHGRLLGDFPAVPSAARVARKLGPVEPSERSHNRLRVQWLLVLMSNSGHYNVLLQQKKHTQYE